MTQNCSGKPTANHCFLICPVCLFLGIGKELLQKDVSNSLKLAHYPDQLREKGSCRLRSDVPQRSHPSGISGISGIIDVLWIHLRNLGTSWPNGTMTDSHGFPPSLQASKPPTKPNPSPKPPKQPSNRHKESLKSASLKMLK